MVPRFFFFFKSTYIKNKLIGVLIVNDNKHNTDNTS